MSGGSYIQKNGILSKFSFFRPKPSEEVTDNQTLQADGWTWFSHSWPSIMADAGSNLDLATRGAAYPALTNNSIRDFPSWLEVWAGRELSGIRLES